MDRINLYSMRFYDKRLPNSANLSMSLTLAVNLKRLKFYQDEHRKPPYAPITVFNEIAIHFIFR